MKKIFFLFFISVSIFSFSQNGFISHAVPNGYDSTLMYRKNTLAIDMYDNKWVAFQKIGLGKYDGNSWIVYNTLNSLLPSDTITALAVDGANNIWVGTFKGLARFDGTNWTVFNTSNSLIPDNNIRSVGADGFTVWVGTYKGAARYNGSSWSVYNTSNSPIANDTIQCFAFEAGKSVYIGTKRGLSNKNNSLWTNYTSTNSPLSNDNISCLFYSQNDIWIGTKGGGLYKGNSGITENIFLSYMSTCVPRDYRDSYITSITQGPSGGVLCLIGSQTELVEIIPSLGKIKKYKISPANFITGGSYLVHSKASNIIWFINAPLSPQYKLYSFDISQYSEPFPEYLPSYDSNCLDINEVGTVLSPDGFMHWNPLSQETQYEVPIGSGKHATYVSGLWIGGLDSVNNLHMAAQEYYGNDFWPGPLDTTNGTIDSATYLQYKKIWNVKRYKIEEFKYYFSLGMVQNGQYVPDSSIITWPAHGTGNYSRNLAPFIDVNGNGIYDPITGGDYPKIKGDQMLYWILNDNLAPHTGSYGGTPFKIEIHVSAYAFTCPQLPDSLEVLNYTTLYNFKIINRSSTNYHDAYITYWQDPDGGNWNDNLLGCYPAENYAYIYNEDSFDDFPYGYGYNPPITSTIILNGPYAEPNDSIDNDNDGTVDELGEKNLLSGNINFMGGCCYPFGSPNNPTDHYYYMTGRWQDGTKMTFGGNGYGGTTPTRHLYPDFPYDTSGWSAYTAGNGASDWKIHTSSGPFSFASKDTTEFDFAIVWSRDTASPWLSKASFDKNLNDNLKIKQWFLQDSFPSCLPTNVSTSEINSLENTLNIFPNPASDIININYKSQTRNSSFEIIDVTGRKIMHFILQGLGWKEKQINISTLSQGLYLLKITDGELRLTKRFIKN